MGSIDIAIFESLPYIGALTDESGDIICVNQAWKEFGEQNGLDPGYDVVGENYLEMVRNANSPLPDSVAEKFSSLLQGKVASFTTEYPCHGPEEPRWFRLYAEEVEPTDKPAALILHENITEERAIQAIADSIWEPLLTHLRHQSEENRSKTPPDEQDIVHENPPIDTDLLKRGVGSILRAAYNTGGAVEGIYSFRNESPYPDWEVRIDQVANQSNRTQQ